MVKLYFYMTINIFMYIYVGENAHWDIYAPPPPTLQIIPQKLFSIFFSFSFQMYIVTNKSQKMFFYKYFYTRAFRG